MNKQNIEFYVRKTLEGQTEAFEELYRLTNKRIYFVCLHLLGNEEDANDALQDTYLTAFKNIHQLSEPAKFSAWLERIAVNRCKDVLKKNKPVPVDDDILKETLLAEDELALPEKYIIDKEKRRVLMDIMRTHLTDLQYQTVILYYFNNLSVSEIADIMECSQGAVMNRLSKARANIKAALDEYQKDSDDKLFVFVGVPFLAKALDEECRASSVPDLGANIMSQIHPHAAGSSAPYSQTIIQNSGKKVTRNMISKKIIIGITTGVIAVGAAVVIIAVNAGKSKAPVSVSATGGEGNTSVNSAIGSASEGDTEDAAQSRDATTVEQFLASGECGENAVYTLSFDGLLTISGTGAIYDYSMEEGDKYPWDSEEVKNIVIESGITRIGSHAFYACDVFETVVIPNTVTSIGEYAFANCKDVEKIELPQSITSLEESAFSGCYNLLEINLPSGLTVISQRLLSDCPNIKNIIIPESVTEIEDFAFARCDSLEELIVPSKVTSIGVFMTDNCRSLKKLSLPEGITVIPNSMCNCCYELEEVNIPESVQAIHISAFEYCTKIKELTVPENVSTIDVYAFHYWEDSQTIIIKGKASGADYVNDSWMEGCNAKIIWQP